MNWGRIITAITAMLCSAWLGSAHWSDGVPYKEILALTAAIVAWGKLEYSSIIKPEISPNDLRLSREIRAAFPREVRSFLIQHDFGASFNSDILETMHSIDYEWSVITKEFDNCELQRVANLLFLVLGDFLGELSKAVDSDGHFLSVPSTTERVSDWFSEETSRKVSMLNEKASKVMTYVDAFERKLKLVAPAEFS